MRMTTRKALFDWLRGKMGGRLSQVEVDQVNAILDGRATPDAPTLPENTGRPHRIGPLGIELIKRFEGCAKKISGGRVQAYWDAHGGVWTIGWGATGEGITRDTIWTMAEADAWFDNHIDRYAGYVRKSLGSALAGTSQRQFDALVSFTYNCGPANLAASTLLRMHKAGNFAGAADQFKSWNRAGGQVLLGLTRRRAAEAELYRSGM